MFKQSDEVLPDFFDMLVVLCQFQAWVNISEKKKQRKKRILMSPKILIFMEVLEVQKMLYWAEGNDLKGTFFDWQVVSNLS